MTPLHWREYAIEALCIGLFMVSACGFSILIFHPASGLHATLGSGAVRRTLMGMLMGLTAVALIYSPWGRRSGAHMNPATTLTFFRLGKVAPLDAAGYVVSQLAGAVAGVLAARALFGMNLGDMRVHYAVTRPGPWGSLPAFLAEGTISALLMTMVLAATASERWQRYTGVFAGLLVWLFITVESPVSGMSMNPARSLGSAAVAGDWSALWIYWSAPLIGMLVAAELHVRRGRAAHGCAKYMHQAPCIFCDYRARSQH